MRKIIITGVALTALSFSDAAAAWSLLASYPTPGPNPRGCAGYSDYQSYIVQDGTPPFIYYMYWPTGSVYASFQAPGGPGACGLFYNTGMLIITNKVNSFIYSITTGGSLISSFMCPVAGPGDLGYYTSYGSNYGSYVFIAIPAQNKIAVVDMNSGSLLGSFAAPGTYPTAYDGHYPSPYYVADSQAHAVYGVVSGITQEIITGIQNPVGMDALWLMNNSVRELAVVDDATDRIYIYRNPSAVEPASWGTLKVLFR